MTPLGWGSKAPATENRWSQAVISADIDGRFTGIVRVHHLALEFLGEFKLPPSFLHGPIFFKTLEWVCLKYTENLAMGSLQRQRSDMIGKSCLMSQVIKANRNKPSKPIVRDKLSNGETRTRCKLNILTEKEWQQWTGMLDAISIRKQIGTLNGIKFIIHTKEHGHNKPHIHAEYQGRNVAIEIETGKILEGSIPLKNETAAQKWVLAHNSLIKKNWNELVDGAIIIV